MRKEKMVSAASYSSQGGREYNEDNYVVVSNKRRLCAIVADGLGGHGGGSLASKAAVEAVQKCFEAQGEKEILNFDDMYAWFNTANKAVLGMQTMQCQMKTTLAVLCMELGGNGAIASHIGDTRIYHFERGEISYISFDHSVSRMAVVSGEITMDGIRSHPDRNKLLRAVGVDNEVTPESRLLPMGSESSNVFLICTDGFWEYVTESVMEETLKASSTPKEWLMKMQAHLGTVAQKENDNNTAVAIFA